MKLFKYILFIIPALILSSCFDEPGTELTWEGGDFVELDLAVPAGGSLDLSYLRLNDGTTYSAGIKVLRASAEAGSAVNVNFEIASTSTAIEGLHYTVTGSSVSIAAGEWTAELPITILADNINAGETFTLDISITGADLPVGDNSTGTANISIQCPSDLTGTVDYEILEGSSWGGTGMTGTMEWTELPSNGSYSWSTYTFQAYQTLYGCCELGGGDLLVTDNCSTLGISSSDGYGCTWAVTVDSVNGDVMVVTLSGDCFGSSTIQMTRQDGATWTLIP